MVADLSVIDDMVYTKMKNYIMTELGTKYSLTIDNFSSVNSSPTDASFPFIYFSKISGSESGYDLEADELHGEQCAYQVIVYDNVSQERVKEVMNSVTKAFKTMMFKITSFPLSVDNASTHTMVQRFSRVIESGDII